MDCNSYDADYNCDAGDLDPEFITEALDHRFGLGRRDNCFTADSDLHYRNQTS